MTPSELKDVLAAHVAWLHDNRNGRRANLYRADLYRADLRKADLCRADLYRADLYRANLQGANLQGTNLQGANLREAEGIAPLGIRSDGYAFYASQQEETVYILAGCRWFPLDEARQHWQDTRGGTPLGDESLAFCGLAEALAKARGWKL